MNADGAVIRELEAALDVIGREHTPTLTLDRVREAADAGSTAFADVEPASTDRLQRPGRRWLALATAAAVAVAGIGLAVVDRDERGPGSTPDDDLPAEVAALVPDTLAVLQPANAFGAPAQQNPYLTWFEHHTSTVQSFARFDSRGLPVATFRLTESRAGGSDGSESIGWGTPAGIDGVDATLTESPWGTTISWVDGSLTVAVHGEGEFSAEELARVAQDVADTGAVDDARVPDGHTEIPTSTSIGATTYHEPAAQLALFEVDRDARLAAAFSLPVARADDPWADERPTESEIEPTSDGHGWIVRTPGEPDVAIVVLDDRRWVSMTAWLSEFGDEVPKIGLVDAGSLPFDSIGPPFGLPRRAEVSASGMVAGARVLVVSYPAPGDGESCHEVVSSWSSAVVTPTVCGTTGDPIVACPPPAPGYAFPGSDTPYVVWMTGDVESIEVTIGGEPAEVEPVRLGGFTFVSVLTGGESMDVRVDGHLEC